MIPPPPVGAAASPLTSARAEVAAALIEAIAGPGALLRPDQEAAVAALCQPAARVLLVQATGWGKSAVYWAATAIRRAEAAGPTLVVSPLLSLMRDQVAASERAGLRAATVNSSNIDAWAQIENDLVADRLDVLLVSPERLANPGFGRRVLDVSAGRLGLLVIDEAHCGLGLGARLPARLPAGLRCAAPSESRHSGACDDGDCQPAGDRRRGRSARRGDPRAARAACPQQPRASGAAVDESRSRVSHGWRSRSLPCQAAASSTP